MNDNILEILQRKFADEEEAFSFDAPADEEWEEVKDFSLICLSCGSVTQPCCGH